MEVTDRPRDQEHGSLPFSLAEAVITSLSLRDLYGIRRLYPHALSVDDAKEIHRLLVEHLGFSFQDVRTLILNGVQASWLPEARKAALRQQLISDPAWEPEP